MYFMTKYTHQFSGSEENIPPAPTHKLNGRSLANIPIPLLFLTKQKSKTKISNTQKNQQNEKGEKQHKEKVIINIYFSNDNDNFQLKDILTYDFISAKII